MKLLRFHVSNYRNILDSGWIEVTDVTAIVGQNEAGKSNLFEALYGINPILSEYKYDIDEDWPVDLYSEKDEAKGKQVCRAEYELSAQDIKSLFEYAAIENQVIDENSSDVSEDTGSSKGEPIDVLNNLPTEMRLIASKSYGYLTEYSFSEPNMDYLDKEKASSWAKENLPKFVFIHDYEMSGAQIELNELQNRLNNIGGNQKRHLLNEEDQTILIILDLANIDIEEFIEKGKDSKGRTLRSFDKRLASKHLTQQFQSLWTQKKVNFEIDIDGTTLNIFAEDEQIGMPVRLHRRSTGFRWYVSFAWKFTHASKGQYKNCILLLEEPGIHLHYAAQKDLVKVFERLSDKNTILYTTHLSSMVDQANPERVRIIESKNNHLSVTHGVVSSQKAPMAVIENSLGLNGDLSGMLGNRQVLIVEGGTDSLILHKLSGLLKADNKEGLSDQIYLWPAQTASKTPMYAGFAVGQKWDAGVLLDSDTAGLEAKAKIEDIYLKNLVDFDKQQFRVLMLGKTAGINKTDAAIEDLFPDQFYIDCVNNAFGLGIHIDDLSVDGSDMITTKIEQILKKRYSHNKLDKSRVLIEMLREFDSWKKTSDLPKGTAQKAAKLIKTINSSFSKDDLKE